MHRWDEKKSPRAFKRNPPTIEIKEKKLYMLATNLQTDINIFKISKKKKIKNTVSKQDILELRRGKKNKTNKIQGRKEELKTGITIRLYHNSFT